MIPNPDRDLSFVCRDTSRQNGVVGDALLPPLGGFLADSVLCADVRGRLVWRPERNIGEQLRNLLFAELFARNPFFWLPFARCLRSVR